MAALSKGMVRSGHRQGDAVNDEPKVLTEADIKRIWMNSDPSAIYKCTCGLSKYHTHTQSCRDADRKRIEEHAQAKAAAIAKEPVK